MVDMEVRSLSCPRGPPCTRPNHTTIRIRVPQREVLAGLSMAASPVDVTMAGSSPTSVLADMAIQFPGGPSTDPRRDATEGQNNAQTKERVQMEREEEQEQPKEDGTGLDEEDFEIVSFEDGF